MAFRLTQGFSRLHNGVDLAAPKGTPVYAVVGGQVVFAGWGGAIPGIARQSGGGNVVEIEADGRVYQYAHLDSIAMRLGSRVSSGALVGRVGNTGYSFGDHLQFAVWQRSVGWLNPLQLYTLSTLIALLSGSSSPAPVAQTVSDTSAAPPVPSTTTTVAVPYGDFFRNVVKPPTSPTFVINAALNEGWAQWVVESYPQVRNLIDDIGKGLPIVGEPSGPTAAQFSAQVKAASIAAARPYIGRTVGTAPATLDVSLPGRFDWVAALGKVAGRLGQGVVLAALLLMGIWLLARGEGSTS